MSFQEAVQTVFSNYANFKGRARRSEYWYFMLFIICVNVVLSLLSSILLMVTGDNSSVLVFIPSILSYVFSFGTLVPQLAVAVRRLHDTGRSGWCYLLNVIPLVGWILLIVWYCGDSQPGDNQYGPNPKGIGGGYGGGYGNGNGGGYGNGNNYYR